MDKIWECPEIQSVNRLPMRSPLMPYESAGSAERDAAAGPEARPVPDTPYYMSLDGLWDFCFFESADGAPEDGAEWAKINVPGSWTMQGYSAPHYTNVQMPFDCAPPFVPDKNPTGYYRLNVALPASWARRRVVLHIGSAESVAVVYVNGSFAGASKDTRLPCEFDITPYIKDNKAEITIKVIRWSDASYVEDQDQWWFGGIHRSVYLYSTEQVFIQDAKALAYCETEGGAARGVIPLEVTLGYVLRGDEKQSAIDALRYEVRYSVRALEGTPREGRPGALAASGAAACSLNVRDTLCTARADIRIEGARFWTSETPALYVVTVSLYDALGRHIESSAFTVGFKSVAVQNRELLLNGKKIYIHGVNRHEHSEYRAKTLSLEEMVRDVKTMKRYNFNAVRTCHYPNDERWYELCDRYGLYVMDEANLENHAYYDVMSRGEEWLNAYVQRVQRMVLRDKNHACVFAWSLGNESGNGQNHAATAAWIRAYDKTRILHYEGYARPPLHQADPTLDSLGGGKGIVDLVSPMYPSIDLIVNYAKYRRDTRPLIMCEYSHAMGNASGSLADYWEAIETTHGLQGGFIWDWIDQGIAARDERGVKYWKYGGDFGDTPTDYDFCLNGINFPDQTPKPAMEECKRLFAPVRLYAVQAAQGLFEVENRSGFTSLNRLTLSWQVLADGARLAGGSVALPAAAPGARAALNISEVARAAGEAPAGSDVVFHADFRYKNDTPFAAAGDVCSADEVVIAEGPTLFARGVEGVSDAAEKLAAAFTPTVFRAFTENEGIKAEYGKVDDVPPPGCFRNKPTKEWLDTHIQDSRAEREGDIFRLVSRRGGQETLFGTCACKTERAGGAGRWLSVSAEFELSGAVSEYPRAGLTAEVGAEFTRVRWYGAGPHECYSDRRYSALRGLYDANIADMGVPYIVPQENSTRCGVKYLELIADDGKAIHIQSDREFSFSILPYTARDLFNCKHTNELTDLSKGPGGKWILTVDAAHRGVGTGACGPDTLEKYRVRPGKYRLDLKLW